MVLVVLFPALVVVVMVEVTLVFPVIRNRLKHKDGMPPNSSNSNNNNNSHSSSNNNNNNNNSNSSISKNTNLSDPTRRPSWLYITIHSLLLNRPRRNSKTRLRFKASSLSRKLDQPTGPFLRRDSLNSSSSRSSSSNNNSNRYSSYRTKGQEVKWWEAKTHS